jgi:GNAT superfamily N-acetyltransferase
MARIMATVAEEGSIGTEPPVDIEARAQRFRDAIEAGPPNACWVLEDAGQIVGNAGAHEQSPGVLYLGMTILPEARGRGGGRALLEAILDHARSCGAHRDSLGAGERGSAQPWRRSTGHVSPRHPRATRRDRDSRLTIRSYESSTMSLTVSRDSEPSMVTVFQ